MSPFEAIWRERTAAREQRRPIAHIRVTRDALPGSVVAVPVSPERARNAGGKMYALPGGAVEVDYDGRALEILLHPQDWDDLLIEQHPGGRYVVDDPTRVMGFPVL